MTAAAGAAARAARNNAHWCDAVCRAQGGDTGWSEQAWWHLGASPRWFPNLVTLDAAAADVERLLGPLLARPALRGFGVKDSFACLDLAGHGFEPLLEGRWVWREADAAPPSDTTGLDWQPVQSPAQLAAWLAAWHAAAADGDGDRPAGPHFGDALRLDPTVELLAGCHAGEVCAGVAVTRSGPVAGLACAFHPPSIEPLAAACALAAQVQRRHPGAALAGWESGSALAGALAAGYRDVGPMRVWLHRG